MPALPKAPPKGKLLELVECNNPACTAQIPYISQAAAALGWQFKLLNGQNSAQGFQQAYDQAVTDKPAAVFGGGGYPPSLFTRQFQQLHSEGAAIGLIDVPSKPANVAIALVTAQTQYQYGVNLADWTISNSEGTPGNDVLYVNIPDLPVYQQFDAGFTKTYSKVCPSCTESVLNVTLASIAQSLPSEVVSYLQAHPNIKYVTFDFANMVDGVPEALAAAGLSGRVKLETTDLTQAELPYLQKGELAVTQAIPWPEIGWSLINGMVRSIMGLPQVNISLPGWLITPSNVPARLPANVGIVTNYQSIFKTAWGG